MMDAQRRGKPNNLLRYQRLLRGWSLKQVVDQLCQLCVEDEDIPGITADMVGKWERGERRPSRYYQGKLCLLYNTTADQLGFIEAQDIPEAHPVEAVHAERAVPTIIDNSLTTIRTLDTLLGSEQTETEIIASHLLSLSGKQLAVLNRLGWTQHDILNALQIVLQGETAMANMNRRQFIHLGAGLLLLSGIDVPTREHPSLEERTQLMKTLGEGIAASWTLFHVSGPEQVLAVSRTQLDLVQQNHTYIYPIVLSWCYSGLYRLIGAALHFQGRYNEAHKAHEKAYLAALEGGNGWNMAQSRSWQAYGWKATGNYADALQATDAALRLVSEQRTIENIRLQARLLALAAENAALMGDAREAETRLRASEQLLEYLPMPHEEFDHTSWLQEAGVCALILKRYNVAITQLRQALQELPPQWSLRYVSTAVPLSKALIHTGELDEALTIVQRTAPVVASLRAAALTQEFTNFLEADLLPKVANDESRQNVVIEAKQQLALV